MHRIIAETDSDIWELSTPELNDTIRVEDNYGRAGSDNDTSDVDIKVMKKHPTCFAITGWLRCDRCASKKYCMDTKGVGNMDTDEMKKFKKEVEERIAVIMCELEKQTGLTIDHVNIDRRTTIGSYNNVIDGVKLNMVL